MDLGKRHEIRAVAVRGRSNSHEFVTEYIVQFSDDGEGWRSYSQDDGVAKVGSVDHFVRCAAYCGRLRLCFQLYSP